MRGNPDGAETDKLAEKRAGAGLRRDPRELVPDLRQSGCARCQARRSAVPRRAGRLSRCASRPRCEFGSSIQSTGTSCDCAARPVRPAPAVRCRRTSSLSLTSGSSWCGNVARASALKPHWASEKCVPECRVQDQVVAAGDDLALCAALDVRTVGQPGADGYVRVSAEQRGNAAGTSAARSVDKSTSM